MCLPASPPAQHRLAQLATLSLVTTLVVLASPAVTLADDGATSALDLVGIWEAKRDFGPLVRGALTITRDEDAWRAEIAGFSVDATIDDCDIAFEIPGGRGSFRGRLETGGPITGHWIQPRTHHGGLEAASPVVLESSGSQRWSGEVVPFEDDFTFYLVVEERQDGTAGAFLRNPDRNFGIILNVDRLEREGDDVRLIGHFFRDTEEAVLSSGSYSPGIDTLSLMLRGRTYDFDRIDNDPGNAFYARGRDPEPYDYRPPPALADGWKVGTLAEVGMSVAPLRELIETEVDPPAQSVHAPYLHGMLIARHGKLVFEEYFHGFHRARTHDTRSASKSATAVLVGAAIEAGEPVGLQTPVYETIFGGQLPEGLDPQARRMTLEHLLTMSSGLDCDDRDSDSPGNEDRMQSQSDNPDWYDYTLSLGMLREPGELAVYCSINPNLVGYVLTAATGESLESLFQRLVAEPLQVERYHLYLQPTGEPYMGGGIHWLLRDFMKIGQVILDGGTWNGRRILSQEFAERSVASLFELRDLHYGYLWWITEYPYKDGTVEAFFAGGNGGQVVMGIPELDLLVAFFAGNYSDSVMSRIQTEFVPEYILPAVD